MFDVARAVHAGRSLASYRLRMSWHDRMVRLASLIVLSGLIVACGGGGGSDGDSEVERTAVTDVATPTATRISGPAVLGEIVWAASVDPVTKEPLEPVTTFPVSAAAISAVLPVTQLPEGVAIAAAWEYNDTTLDAFDQTIVAERDYVEGWIEFRLTRGELEAWPDGTYEITVQSGDQVLQTAQVSVR